MSASHPQSNPQASSLGPKAWGILMSLLLPGTGHFLIHRNWRGLGWGLLALGLKLSFSLAPRELVVALLITHFASAIDVGLCEQRRVTAWGQAFLLGMSLFATQKIALMLWDRFGVAALAVAHNQDAPQWQQGDVVLVRRWEQQAALKPGDCVAVSSLQAVTSDPANIADQRIVCLANHLAAGEPIPHQGALISREAVLGTVISIGYSVDASWDWRWERFGLKPTL